MSNNRALLIEISTLKTEVVNLTTQITELQASHQELCSLLRNVKKLGQTTQSVYEPVKNRKQSDPNTINFEDMTEEQIFLQQYKNGKRISSTEASEIIKICNIKMN